MRVNKIRVLHYAPGFDHGGIESRLLDWYSNIDRERIHFDLLIQTPLENPLLREFEGLGGTVSSLGRIDPSRPFRFRHKVAEFFASREPYDVVHCHSVETSFLVMRAAKRAGTNRLVLHSRTRSHATQTAIPLRRFMKYLSVRAATDLFACSEEAGRFMTEDVRWKRPEFTVVRNGFQADEFRYNGESRREVRGELGVEGSFVIATVGRLTAVKNQMFLLDVFLEIRRRLRPMKLLIVGEGPMRSDLESRAKELGIADDVLLVGSRRDVPRLLQGADAFVLPSLYEGFGTVAVEAQAAGLHTVVSTGVPESVRATNLLTRLSVGSGFTSWADEILRAAPVSERRDTFEEIEAAGFNAAGTARFLERFYLESSDRVGVEF